MSLENKGGGLGALFEGIDLEQPVGMLNQIRFHDRAQYEAGAGEEACSGAEAYARYGAACDAVLKDIGARLILNGMVEMIGPQDEWDMSFVVRYNRGADLLEMLATDAYQAIVHHRTAAVKDSRLMMMRFAQDELLGKMKG